MCKGDMLENIESRFVRCSATPNGFDWLDSCEYGNYAHFPGVYSGKLSQKHAPGHVRSGRRRKLGIATSPLFEITQPHVSNLPPVVVDEEATLAVFFCFSITIPILAKEFHAPPKPLSCVRQCYSRYHSAAQY